MPKHLSLGTVVEKNRIASTNTFILMAEIDVTDDVTGAFVETIYLARNNEDILFEGNVYKATGFEFESHETSETIPELTVSVEDPTRAIAAKCEEYAGGVGWKVRFKLVNSGDLDAPAEIEEMVYILGGNAQDYAVEFTLGAQNPLAQRFPKGLQWRDKCLWKFKGKECKYTGPDTVCDYTLQGPNGCSVKGNTLRFRGLPGLRPR